MKLIDLLRIIKVPDVKSQTITKIGFASGIYDRVVPIPFFRNNLKSKLLPEEYIYSVFQYGVWELLIGTKKTRGVFFKDNIISDIDIKNLYQDLNEDESYLVLKYGKILLEEI